MSDNLILATGIATVILLTICLMYLENKDKKDKGE